MELMDIYNQIKNPLDDPKVIEKLINAYANSSQSLGGFYGRLTKCAKKSSTTGQYYVADGDRFHSMLFNKWKNSIVNMTHEDYLKRYKSGDSDDGFVRMRRYLKTIPNVSTAKEAHEIFYGQKKDSELEKALKKYTWEALGCYSSWIHVCSRYLTANKDSYPNIEHRLYLDTESLDTYKMATLIVEKCDEHNFPYYFKFDDYGDRDDTIVIYSSTENLPKYIEVLRQIKREHPDLVARTNEPPLLTGKIDGWIGYGSEPEKTPDGKNQSFNGVRSKAIESAIDRVTKNWVYNHRNMPITYQNKKISFKRYVTIKVVDAFIERLEERFNMYEDMDKKDAQSKGMTYNQSTVINNLGYSLRDIRYPKFKQMLIDYFDKNMNGLLDYVCNDRKGPSPSLKMNVRNGKEIVFSISILETLIEELSLQIMKVDPNYISSVRTEIINESRKYGIDENKYCFDIKKREKLKMLSNQMKKQSTQVANVNMSKLNVNNITQIIDPLLLKRNLKLPNGLEMSAQEYIQKVVFPHLPKNGVVIMADGTFMSVKRFIEDCIVGECQTKYRGNFPKYMTEKTRSNIGVVSIDTVDGREEIRPERITEWINPILLEGKVRLPNGSVITAERFVKEFFAPHIPANGRIILDSGMEVHAVQFIEKLLMGPVQTDEYIDISRVLYSMRRNNTGLINAEANSVKFNLAYLKNQLNNLNQPNFGGGPKM